MEQATQEVADVQQRCLKRYLEIYPEVLKNALKLPVQIGKDGLTDNGERSVMRAAVEQVRKELNKEYLFLAKPTNEVCNTWIDRANTIRARIPRDLYQQRG